MDKMINSAKFFHTGSKVMCGIFHAATWICGVVAVLVWFLPESMFWGGAESISFGPVTAVLKADGMLAPIWVRTGIFEELLLCLIVLFFACRVLRIIQNILEPMTQGQPFMDTVAPNLKRLAWLCLIGGAVSEIAKAAYFALAYGQRNLMNYFNPQVVESVEVSYVLNLWFLPIFVLLMLMSYVFAYGQQLQQLSDETL